MANSHINIEERSIFATVIKTIISMEDIKKMPLWLRLIGAIVDKVTITFVFFVSLCVIAPYWTPETLGIYVGLLGVSPTQYEYINSYAWYADLSVTTIFTIYNLIYYLICEGVLSASLGKWVLGGRLVDECGNRIKWENVIYRGICKLVLIASTYFILHIHLKLSNLIVIIVFHAILDIPVLMNGRSLIDRVSNTQYSK